MGNDGKNAEVAVQAEMLSIEREKDKLTCIIHIVDPQLWYLLREKELQNPPESHFRLGLFNIFDHGASLLLKMYSPWNLGKENSSTGHRIILVGLGSLGQSLVIQASLQWSGQRTDDESRLRGPGR